MAIIPKAAYSESSDDESIFEIEQIVDKRVKNGKNEYKIKWKGFDE